jgi:hypothetical protein
MNKLNHHFELNKYGLHARLVNEDDAEFIVRLRTDPQLARYVNPVADDVSKQRLWISEYKERERMGEDYYFMFDLDGVRYGMDRIYDINGKNFITGSWVFSSSSPVGMAVLAGIITKEIAYELLGLENSFADVRKNNKAVLRHNKQFHPTVLSEDEENISLSFDRSEFYKCRGAIVKACLGVMNVTEENE